MICPNCLPTQIVHMLQIDVGVCCSGTAGMHALQTDWKCTYCNSEFWTQVEFKEIKRGVHERHESGDGV